MIKILREKDIREALKKPDGIGYLKREFQFTSESQVCSAIRQVLPAEAENIIAKMRAQQKRVQQRNNNATPVTVPLAHPNIPQMDEIIHSMNSKPWGVSGMIRSHLENMGCQQDCVPTELKAVRESAKTEDKKDATGELAEGGVARMNSFPCESGANNTNCSEVLTEMSYEELLKYKEELVAVLNESEKNLQACQADTSERHREMELLKKTIEDIKAEIRRLVSRYKTVFESYCASVEKTKNAEAYKQFVSKQLTETEKQLAKLQHVSVCVYSTGNVEVENAEVPAIPETDIWQSVSNLVATPGTGNFKVNELKGVAKLQFMVKIFRDAGREVDVLFENPNLQVLWEDINK